MELWIRSKNKETLLKINACSYLFDDEEKAHFIAGFGIDHNQNQNLGTYSSKERCLEVLDEIQELINCLNGEVNEIYNSVYEMPKE